MLALIRKLFAPPVFEDEEKTRVAALVNIVLWVLAVATLASFALVVADDPDSLRLTDVVLGVASVLFLILTVVLRLGYVHLAGALMLLVMWTGVTIPIYAYDGIRSTAMTGYYVVVVLASFMLNKRIMSVFSALCLLSSLGAYLAEVNGLIGTLPTPPILSDIVFVIGGLGVAAFILYFIVSNAVAGLVRARIGTQALRDSNLDLQVSRDALDAQARQLEHRARYLEVTAAVAQDAASMLTMEALLSRATALIGSQFGFYHVGLFLLDSSGEWAELRAASGEGGQQMLVRGHRLRVGQEGVVGRVVGSGESRVALDKGDDAEYFGNPDLPAARSELALPLRAGGEIIGALDVQSTLPEAFREEDVAALQALADQVAVSISNARLFQQVQEALAAERRAYGESSRDAWRNLLRTRSGLGFVKEHGVISAAEGVWDPEMEQVLRTGEVVSREDGRGSVIPVKVRDLVIGVIDAYKPEGAGEWTTEEIAFMEALVEQLGLALESARLYQDSQHRATRERVVSEVAARMRETLDIDTVLQMAIQNMGDALGISEVEVRMCGDVITES
jgi:GAF domain-containing protein